MRQNACYECVSAKRSLFFRIICFTCGFSFLLMNCLRASFRSSYDATQHNSPALQNGTVMPAAMPQMYHQPPGIPGPIPDSGPAKEVNNQTKKKGRPKKVKEEPSLVGG